MMLTSTFPLVLLRGILLVIWHESRVPPLGTTSRVPQANTSDYPYGKSGVNFFLLFSEPGHLSFPRR